MNPIYSLHQGSVPMLISMPHNGTEIPAELKARMTPAAHRVADTDWFLDRLYGFAKDLGCSMLNPRYSRYVIDLNRAPDGQILYAGANNTELCPTSTFAEEPIYQPGEQPDETEIAERVGKYWQSYHQAIIDELARIKAQHGYALLFEAHTIRSEVPRFFQGRLPDINFGNADGKSCLESLVKPLAHIDYAPYTQVLNGRFKGGYITRHYGQPERNVHALQLELSQITYLDEKTLQWHDNNASKIMPVLQRIVEVLLLVGNPALSK